MKKIGLLILPAVLTLGAAQPGAIVDGNQAKPAEGDRMRSVRDSAGRIASQPVKDVGVVRTNFPPVLLAAREDPYSLNGIKTCRQISAAFAELSEALGPDFAAGPAKKENRAGKLAEAGGQTVVNSLIPFRGLVREITGAAPAQRRLNSAIDAGYARRGFLRGLHTARRCRTPLS